MGVKELWTILSPAKKEIGLDSLSGQVIAVDLSVWICENQGVKAVQGKVSKPHLRNLFFRISNLIQLGITLVFVVDGDPPELKWETISNRINSRYKGRGRGYIKNNKSIKPGRSHFKSQIKECLELLDHLGVPYVQSKGEAEALCALLNQEGIVDGCITEDGDVFLYGATTVYKNFNLTGKNPVIDCYKMADIKEQLGLSRETLVALALLLGCDYVPKGVPGVGKVHALQLMAQFQGSNILERFKQWGNGNVDFQLSLPSKPAHCTRCHHIGSAQKHKIGGCPLCGRSSSCASVKNGPPCTCEWHRRKQEFDKCAPERDIMLKALDVPGFPHLNVIEEFLNVKDTCPRHPLKFERPKMLKIMKFALEKLEWPEKYTREKVIDLVIFYDLQNTKEDVSGGESLDVDSLVKRRIRNGVPCVEVLWKLPDEWKLEEDESDVISTVENFDLFKSVFPDLVEEFESVEASKKESKKGKKKKTAIASSADTALSCDREDVETVTDKLSGLMLQNKGTSEETSGLVVHNEKGLCLQKDEVTFSNYLLDNSTSNQNHVLPDSKVSAVFEGKEELRSQCGADVELGEGETFTQISDFDCIHSNRSRECKQSLTTAASCFEKNDEVSHQVNQTLDGSVVLSLAERLALKRRQKVYGLNKSHLVDRKPELERVLPEEEFGSNFGQDEDDGGSGTSNAEFIKEQGMFEGEGYMERKYGPVTHISHRSHQKVHSEEAGKHSRQGIEKVEGRNLSQAVPGGCVSHVRSVTSSSMTMCPELFNISTPEVSLVDGDTVMTLSSIEQCKMVQNGQEMSSVCPKVHDISTPNVTLLVGGEASDDRHGQDKMVQKDEIASDISAKKYIALIKVEGNLDVNEDIYDLCTPEASFVNSDNEKQELVHASMVTLKDESENGNSPVCSGSCDVMKAVKLAIGKGEGDSLGMKATLKQNGSFPLEATELYDLCIPDTSTLVDQKGDVMICEEDEVQDVIEISDDDDDLYKGSVNGCVQDSCNDLEEHLRDGCVHGEDRGGEFNDEDGGQEIRSTPECSMWEEPTALNINTPSQTVVTTTPFTNSSRIICKEDEEQWQYDVSEVLHDSRQTSNQYSQLRSSGTCATLTVEKPFLLGDNGNITPSSRWENSTMQEKSMDHSLFQKLNFSLGFSGWTFSPLSKSSSTVKSKQFYQDKVLNVTRDSKYLNRKDSLRANAEIVGDKKDGHTCSDSVYIEKRLEWHTDEHVLTKSINQRTIAKEDGPLLEGKVGWDENIVDKSDPEEHNGVSRKIANQTQCAGHEQLLVEQPSIAKLGNKEREKKVLCGTGVTSDRNGSGSVSDRGITSNRRGSGNEIGMSEGNGKVLPCEEHYREGILRESSNHRTRYEMSTGRDSKHQRKDEEGKNGEQLLTNHDISKDCISQSNTSMKGQKNTGIREINFCNDKENSPVSLMDRLRKKSARTRDILNSMELE